MKQIKNSKMIDFNPITFIFNMNGLNTLVKRQI